MKFNSKRVLITGITGFVGSKMAKRLVDEGAEVYGLQRRRADGVLPHNLKKQGIGSQVKLVEGDIEDISSIAAALKQSDPQFVFHLAAQSFVPRSFASPLETEAANCLGTASLLEAIRIKDVDPVVVFAGSSEEYGLVISSEEQHRRAIEKYGTVFPKPEKIPEVPIKETNPLRPMSPYAVSKVYGDYLMRNYRHSYGLKTVVSRAFNHEGAGRGAMFVTSVITSQVMKLVMGEADKIRIGNVNAFRDWSHVSDVIDGYFLLAEKGQYGDVYNQGSMRTNSVLSYILISLERAGYPITKIETLRGEKAVEDPTDPDLSEIFGSNFEKTKIDGMMLRGEVEFGAEDRGVVAHSGTKRVAIEFDPERFRPAEVPILFSDTGKIGGLGFEAKRCLGDVIEDQLNYYLSIDERKG
jgi:GDPmannose 4,6-dehydratase